MATTLPNNSSRGRKKNYRESASCLLSRLQWKQKTRFTYFQFTELKVFERVNRKKKSCIFFPLPFYLVTENKIKKYHTFCAIFFL